MRVLVIGATGYVASRAIPVLLERGHAVVAGARTLSTLDRRWWRDRVDAVALDVLDEASVAAAFAEPPDAVLYLVHGMADDGFDEADRAAASTVRAASDAAGVERIVYLSGIIPAEQDEALSEHLRSRLEVERILSASSATVVTLRAAMLVGAGSTSLALMQQLARRLPVTVLPTWMRHEVEPLAITDLCLAIDGALDWEGGTRHFDVGSGHRLSYPQLIERSLELADASRPSLVLPALPESLVARMAGWIADVPSPTVEALIESLRHDMVATDDEWRGVLADGAAPLALDEALRRAMAAPRLELRPSRRDPLAAMPGDPSWAASAE